eukprot:6212023-Pleurochrysis_carterae.AAC.3
MRYGVCPKRGRRPAGQQIRTRELHYAAYSSLGHAVQLVDVRWTCRGMYALVREELRELS